MTFQLVNNVKMTLATDIEPYVTELIVLDTDLSAAEAYDPTKQLALTLIGDEELNQYEIVYVTERTGTTFTVTRGEENTTAGSWSGGTSIVAALTAEVLHGVTQAPTTGDNVSYGGGNFGASSTVEEALDDQGDAIIRLASDTDYYEAVQQRVGGGLFSEGAINTSVLRWQGSCKRFVTAGFGAPITTFANMATPTVVPDMAICLRCADVSNWGTVKIRAFNTALPENYIEWSILSTAMPTNNAWLIAFGPATNGTIGGTPASILPDRIYLEFKDDATGPLTIDVNFVDVIPVRLSYLGSFIHVVTNADFDKVNVIAQYGFRVSMVIKDTDLLTLSQTTLRKMQVDGHRIYLTSASNFKAQTVQQCLTTLYTALRNAFAIYVKPDGWVYINNYDGPFDVDPNTTIRGTVATVFPRGVGIGTFRTAVEVYRFDDPLIIAASVAQATTLLTGSDKTAINIDLSILTLAELNTLMTAVVTSKNFYTTTLDYQNADNLKSGTVSVERLPVIPGNLGGVPPGTCIWSAQATAPAGYLAANGQAVSRTTYATLFAAIGVQFGVGDGSTTFAVPDMRGVFVRGLDSGRGTDPARVLGSLQTEALKTHAHVASSGNPSANHTHLISGSTGTVSAFHTHTTPFTTIGTTQGTGAGADIANSTYGSTGYNAVSGTESANHTHAMSFQSGTVSAWHTHPITVDAFGDTETRPINIALRGYIKT